jgi:hypothetical protein
MSAGRTGCRFWAAALVGATSGLVGCGGIAGSGTVPPTLASPDASIADAGALDEGGQDPEASPTSCTHDAGGSCPSAMPASGTPCPASLAYLSCTYGDSPTTQCRHAVQCQYSSVWAWADTSATCDADSTCPAGTEPGVSCDAADICGEADGTLCVCEANLWNCAAPPDDGGCPQITPNEGTCCDPTVVTGPCAYGVGRSPCLLGVFTMCSPQSSTWVWQDGCEHP